jgi:DNA primase
MMRNAPVPRTVVEHARSSDVPGYLARRGLRFKPSKNNWALVRCPIHKAGEEAHPSFTVNLETGGFFCFACGAKGGDLIALHRVLTGSTFRDAVLELAGDI